MGGLNQFTPYVLRPSGVPSVTSKRKARKNPELAVLSAMAHGRDADIERAVKIANAAISACSRLDFDHSKIYLDLILNSLTEAARQALNKMDTRTYVYQSEFARTYIARGRSEGEAHGRAALIIRLLARRFGRLGKAVESQIQSACIADLESIGDRLLTAATLQEALGQRQALLLLFRNRPALAAELIRDVLGGNLPAFHEARVASADLTDGQPAGCRAGSDSD